MAVVSRNLSERGSLGLLIYPEAHLAERLTWHVSRNLSEWSRPTGALLRTSLPQESDDGVTF